MPANWESHLEQWTSAGVVDTATAGKIRTWEASQARSGGLRWPILLALAFGALTLGAGVLLFVSAHWDQLDSGERMTLLLVMVGIFHAGGAAAAARFESLSIALHTVGTVALGAGIALAGQIFHLSEHWPTAVLLWALGAVIGWILLRHWTQAALVAILVPYWLAGEWWVRMSEIRYYPTLVAAGICALSFTYLTALRAGNNSPLRRALGWLGGIALLPAALVAAAGTPQDWIFGIRPSELQAVTWSVAAFLPLALAVVLRGRDAVWNGIAIVWALLLPSISAGPGDHILVYVWCAIGSIGLACWGVRESRTERINLAMAGFAITLLAFYFSSVMDKLGRSASLIVLGLLFLGGGWLLERTRRRLISQIRQEAI
jgi:uncharacterized membrane protein